MSQLLYDINDTTVHNISFIYLYTSCVSLLDRIKTYPNSPPERTSVKIRPGFYIFPVTSLSSFSKVCFPHGTYFVFVHPFSFLQLLFDTQYQDFVFPLDTYLLLYILSLCENIKK